MQAKIQTVKDLVNKYQLNDVRTIGLIIFCLIVVGVTWSGAKAIQLNFALQKRVSAIEQQNDVLELENQTQKLKNEYFKTDEFKELEARRVLGKALPGERVYIVPEQVASAKLKTSEKVEAQAISEPEVQRSKTQQNFQDWMDFFLGRSL